MKTVKEQLADMREITILEKERTPILEEGYIKQNLGTLKTQASKQKKETDNKFEQFIISSNELEWDTLKSLNHPRVDELIQAHNDTLKHQNDALSKRVYGKYYRKACDSVLSDTKLTQKMEALVPNLVKVLINEKKQREKDKSQEYLP